MITRNSNLNPLATDTPPVGAASRDDSMTTGMRTHLMMACLMIAGPVLADPATPPDSYVEIRILDPESKLIASSTDQETIRFAVNAMERAGNVGSNAYQMSLTHYLHLVQPRQEKPGPTRGSR